MTNQIVNSSDPKNPIYSITTEQGLELRRLFVRSVDCENNPKNASMLNRLIYNNNISHKSLFYIVTSIADHSDQALPDWILKCFDLRKELMNQEERA